MIEAGFASALDVDLSLAADDAEPCMIRGCGAEAVWNGVITCPCGHDQLLCLSDFERERPRWSPGDDIWCYLCEFSQDNEGVFVRWERVRRG